MTPATRDRATLWVIAAMALVAAGYPTFVAHEVTLLAPMCLLPVLVLIAGDGSRQPWWFVFCLALLGWALVSHSIMGGTFNRLVHTISMYVPFAALAFRIRRPEWLALKFAVITVALVEARIVVAFLAAGGEWRPWQVDDGNVLVAKLNVLLPLVFLSWLQARDRGESRGPYLVLLCTGVLCVFLVLSRLGIGVLVALMVIAAARADWRIPVAAGASSVAAWWLAPGAVSALLKKARLLGFKPVAPRREIWREALEAVRESPWLGVGPGNADRALRRTQNVHAHNNVVQATLENGWPGGLLILGLMVYLAALTARLLWRGGRSTFWALSLLAYGGTAMVSAPIQRPDFTLAVIIVVMAVRDRAWVAE